LLTYDYFRQWWLDKKNKGFLRDPKYDDAMSPDLERDKALYGRYRALKARGGN